MFLDLTPDQIAFKAEIEQFARDVVAPRAAAIDAGGEFPSDVMQAAAGFGLLGVTVSTVWGGAGRDYVSYALAIEAIGRVSATVAASLVVLESSQPMPVALVATVGKRIDERRWKELETAFLRLTEDRSARNALDGVRMAGFVPLDEAALAAVRAAWRRAQ